MLFHSNVKAPAAPIIDMTITPSFTLPKTTQTSILNTPTVSVNTSIPTQSFTPTGTFSPSETPTQLDIPSPTISALMTSTIYPSATGITCSPPIGWVIYTVQPSDSLYLIGLTYGVTVSQLQIANCLGSSVTIYVGQKLYVPNIPTHTPQPAPAPTRTPTKDVIPPTVETMEVSATPAPTATQIPEMPTSTNTPLPTIAETHAPTVVPTDTSVVPTLTPIPTLIATPVP
jgi:LysM repeat protein